MSEPMWAVVELMGHVRMAGLLAEVEMFGAKLGRLDVPKTDPCTCANGSKLELLSPTLPCDRCHGAGFVHAFTTTFFGGSSVYRITPCTEETARAVAKGNQPAPVHSWEIPKALPSPARVVADDDEDIPY